MTYFVNIFDNEDEAMRLRNPPTINNGEHPGVLSPSALLL
jgi:hypothetical protein